MAEKHEHLVTKYKGILLKMGYNIMRKSPFVDYRPDVCAVRKNQTLFAEIELVKSLHYNHTLDQLNSMHRYVRRSKTSSGVLVVPRSIVAQANLLVQSIFGDNTIRVIGL